MSGQTYDLKHPITITLKNNGGEREEKVDSVNIREPRGKDMRKLDQISGEIAQSLFMIELLTGLDGYQVDEMHAVDIGAIGEIIEGFMGNGKPTG